MRITSSVIAAAVLAYAPPAGAMPIAPEIFCEAYPDACASGIAPDCTYCHTTPPAHNAFGVAIEERFTDGLRRPLDDATFERELLAALLAIELDDADQDGFPNVDEIRAGSLPGDPKSTPGDTPATRCPESAEANGGYDTCRYQPSYVFRKVHQDFCGYTPDLDEMRAFAEDSDPMAAIDRALDTCLLSDFWRGRDGVLWILASPKITPLGIVKSGEDQGLFAIADYYDDYNLYAYAQTDNHDAREVLTAQFIVRYDPGPPIRYVREDRTSEEDVAARGIDRAQLVDTDRRAGMLTTRWTLFYHTMFSTMPRTTAAQMYRSYLGLDIAKLEGLYPVAGEPVDYDDRGVGGQGCRDCHSTLDPLAYPFSRYEGILLALSNIGENGISDGASGFDALYGDTGATLTYLPDRLEQIAAAGLEVSTVVGAPASGSIFGQPVNDLREWARVAADSSAFARATVLEYWRYALGSPPDPAELPEFDQLWKRFPDEHAYGVERMLHDLIRTEAYGVP